MTEWPADEVARKAVSSLVPFARNSRIHADDQIDQVARSITEWGWTNPVLIAEDGTIIAGHARVLAAQKLGLPEVPVMVARGWSEAQIRAYVIADNKLAENAGWDQKMLASELQELAGGFDLSLIGFSEAEIERLLANNAEDAGDLDEAPEPPADPITRPGDLWICGEHRVLCGDASILADVEKVLGGELADMAFTDPPYNINYANSAKDKLRGKNRPILNDALGVCLAHYAPRLNRHLQAAEFRGDYTTSAKRLPNNNRCIITRGALFPRNVGIILGSMKPAPFAPDLFAANSTPRPQPEAERKMVNATAESEAR